MKQEEFQEKVLQELKAHGEKLQELDRKLEIHDEKLQKQEEVQEKVLQELKVHGEKLQELDKKLEIHDEKLQEVDKKLGVHDEKLQKLDEDVEDIKKLLIKIEYYVTERIPALFDAYSSNQDKHKQYDDEIDQLNKTTYNHDIRISVLEDTSKKHEDKISNLVS